MGGDDHQRERLIINGLIQLSRNGPTIGLETVSLATAASAAGMPVSEASSMWGDGDLTEEQAQRRFRDAVAVRVLSRQPAADDEGQMGSTAVPETIESLAAAAGDMPPVEDMSPDERARWLRRLYRAGTDANLELTDSMVWRSLEPLASTVLANPGAHPVLYEAWRQGDLETSGRYLNVISTMASVFGMRLRYCYTGEQFATALTGLSQGLLPRVGRVDESHEVDRATGLDGEMERWSLFAVCVEALIHQFFEPEVPGSVATEHEDGPRGGVG